MRHADMILDFVKQGATYDLFEVFSPYCGLGYNDPKNGFIPLQPEMNIVIGMEKYENFVDKLIASTREKGASQKMFSHIATVYRKSYDMFIRTEDGERETVFRCKAWNNNSGDDFAQFSYDMYLRVLEQEVGEMNE